MACASAACWRAFASRLMRGASHRRSAGRRGPMPRARRQRSERRRARSRRSSGLIGFISFRQPSNHRFNRGDRRTRRQLRCVLINRDCSALPDGRPVCPPQATEKRTFPQAQFAPQADICTSGLLSLSFIHVGRLNIHRFNCSKMTCPEGLEGRVRIAPGMRRRPGEVSQSG